MEKGVGLFMSWKMKVEMCVLKFLCFNTINAFEQRRATPDSTLKINS